MDLSWKTVQQDLTLGQRKTFVGMIYVSESSFDHIFRKLSRKEAFTSVQSSIHRSIIHQKEYNIVKHNIITSYKFKTHNHIPFLCHRQYNKIIVTILSQPRPLTVQVE